MSNKKVLNLYKQLFKICKEVFDKDNRALSEAKQRIRVEFRKNKDLQKKIDIAEKIQVGEDVGKILKTQLVQLVCKNPETNSYEMNIRKDTAKLDNVIFKPDALLPYKPRTKKCS